MTFGFPQRTGIDWLTYLADQARERQLFRLDVTERTNHRDLAEATAALAGAHSPAKFLAARQQQQRPGRRVITGGAFGPPSAVVCVTEFAPHIEATGETVVVTAAGIKLTFAARALPALKMLLSGDPVEIADVTQATGMGAAVLADVLIKEGLCAGMTDALSLAYTALT